MSAPRVLVIPSWYPSRDQGVSGIFIYQQVSALRALTEVAVLFVREAVDGQHPNLLDEGGLPVVRAQLQMPPATRAVVGRVRAVATNLYNKFWLYPRVGSAAFETLRETWGMPDVIHVQALWPAALIARRISRRYGVPYVVTEHSEEYMARSTRRLVKYPVFVRAVLRPLALGASATIVVSRSLGDRLTELGLARSTVVIPNVVPVSCPASLRTEVPHTIVHVSLMGPAKNLPLLLDAIDLLRGHRSDFLLRLVGDGERRIWAEEIVDRRRLGDVVEFTGSKSAEEVRNILADAAFTVVSSTHETFSVTAAESLMTGRPVVSTRCGGPEEFVTDEVGRLVNADDVTALADGLDWMLDHYADFDPEFLHRFAAERFAPEVVAARIIGVYGEVLGD